MQSLLIFFLFLFAIRLHALGSCPDYPTLPTGSIPSSSPLLITPSSAGITNFPSSTQQLSMTMRITPNEACPTGGTFNLFSMSVGSSTPKTFKLYLDCSSLKVSYSGSLLGSTTLLPNLFSSMGPIEIFLSFDLNAQRLRGETLLQTQNIIFITLISTTGYYFDTNSKFYLCADSTGASARACTISEFVFEYRYYGENSFTYAHLGGTNPTLTALYPLAEGSLASLVTSTSSAYFGDSASTPTAGTSPAWDASNNFVSITAGQFLTIPLPSLSSTNSEISASFSVAAWVKITSIPTTQPTIFTLYSSTGTQVGFELLVLQTTKEVSINFPTAAFSTTGTAPIITLNTWQLVGFAAYISSDKKTSEGTIFVDAAWAQFYGLNTASTMDLSTASVLRIGDATNSVSGSISAVSIMTPGGGIVRTSSLCSGFDLVELGVDSFALACSGSNVLSLSESKCYLACPDGTRLVSGTPVSFCVSCPKDNCATCDSTQCLTCISTYILYQQSCLSSCPDKMYYDGTTCQSCPTACSECTSPVSCQACSSGYTLLNSYCFIIPSSSSSKTTATATQAIASVASVVGSVVSVGSSVIPTVSLVSEVVQNTRYLNLSVTDELAEIYKTFSTDLITWDLPNFLTKVEDFKPLSVLFSRYDLDSSFLVNFYSTMMTVGVSFLVLIGCLGIQKWYLERRKSRGFFDSVVQKVLAGSINFIVVQAYGCLDNILFYFVLDAKTNPFNATYPRASFAFGIVFVIGSISLMIYSIRVVQKYHVLKREGLAKNNMKALEAHQKKNKYLEVFYGDFNDADVWSHCFLAFLVLRSNVSSLILTILYDYPLMQTIFLITLDGGILTFMLIEKPLPTLRGVFFQYYFEAIALTVHICTLILSWDDEPPEGLKKGASTAIIYLNTAIVTGGLCFISIDVHETVREKINEWKLKKAEKKNAVVVFPVAEESGIALQIDSSGLAETRPSEKKLDLDNLENNSSSLQQTKIQRKNPKNSKNPKNPRNQNLQSPQIKSTRRRPRIEFINDQDFDLP